MDSSTSQNVASPSLLRRLLADRQFVVCAVILAVSAALWSTATSAFRLSLTKKTIPWPAGVEVTDDFRLESLPQTLGSYVIAPDGFFKDKDGRYTRDGKPDGEIAIPDDERNILGVGTPLDAPRRDSRQSNWYLCRYYINTKAADPALSLWRVDLSFYDGSTDKVAHVPGRCMVASGATPTGETTLNFPIGPNPADWGPTFKINRSKFIQGQGTGEILQYYTFSLNGNNEPSWKKVRWHLAAALTEKYGYFAKIQFGPAQQVYDVEAADRAAQEFAKVFLPEILRSLPTAQQMNALNHGNDRP